MNQKLMGLNGDEAVAYATKQINPDVVAAYPITPQTIIVERFSEYVADGLVDTEFVAVESEHSALSTCVAASAAGARAFTATAANGLALMWEITYIASGLRQPIVMAVANRALSGPINIHNDHSDSMGARDSGWIQIYCENSQEVYDASIAAWRIGEHHKIQLPVMVCLDGFTLSHTMENVMTLPDKEVEAFIGEREFHKVKGHSGVADLRLDPVVPLTLGPLDLQDFYFEHKIHQAEAMKEAIKYMPELDETFSEYSHRRYNSVEPYMMDDAEIAIIGLGSTMGTVRYVVRALRSKGVKAGMVKIRIYRPFPEDDLKDAVGDTSIFGIMDKAASFGAPGGPLFSDIRNAFYDEPKRPQIFNYIYGLGGRDTGPEMIKGIYDDLNMKRGKSSIDERVKYIGVRE